MKKILTPEELKQGQEVFETRVKDQIEFDKNQKPTIVKTLTIPTYKLTGDSYYLAGRGTAFTAELLEDTMSKDLRNLIGTNVNGFKIIGVESFAVMFQMAGRNIGLLVRETCTFCKGRGKHLSPDVAEPILINCSKKGCPFVKV